MKITANRFWSTERVRQACIDNDLYTKGSNEDYIKMFDMVRELEPTNENLYLVAKNIYEHSAYQTITNVMFIFENDAVITTFEIDGHDDI